MANNIAIIELHDAENQEDLQQLDAAMAGRHSPPKIRDEDGDAYRLPNASQNTDMVPRAAHDALLRQLKVGSSSA